MRPTRKVAVAACMVAAAATVLTACSSSGSGTGGSSGNPTSANLSDNSGNTKVGYNSAANNVINPSTKVGGTLNLLSGGDCDSWDPGRTYYGWCFNMQRLFTPHPRGLHEGQRRQLQDRR